MFQGCFKKVSWVFQGRLKGVSMEFYVGFKGIKNGSMSVLGKCCKDVSKKV